MVGGVVSRTVTSKPPCASLPAVSVAVQVTVVLPKGKVLPEGGVQVTSGLVGSRSVAVGGGQATLAPSGPVASSVMSSGRSSTGGVMSSSAVRQFDPVHLLSASSLILREE